MNNEKPQRLSKNQRRRLNRRRREEMRIQKDSEGVPEAITKPPHPLDKLKYFLHRLSIKIFGH